MQGPWEYKSIGVIIAGSSWGTFSSFTHGRPCAQSCPTALRSLVCPGAGFPLAARLKCDDHRGGRGAFAPTVPLHRRFSVLIFNHSGAPSSRSITNLQMVVELEFKSSSMVSKYNRQGYTAPLPLSNGPKPYLKEKLSQNTLKPSSTLQISQKNAFFGCLQNNSP